MEGDQVKLKEKDQVRRLWHTYLVILTQNFFGKEHFLRPSFQSLA